MVQAHGTRVIAVALEVCAEPFILLVDGILPDMRQAEESEEAGEYGERAGNPEGILARGDS